MPQIKLETLRDFRGGLNLQTDATKLTANESPDMLNVDPDPRGGVRQRRGVLPFAQQLSSARVPQSMWEFNANGRQQILLSTNNGVVYSTGGNWTVAFFRSGVCRAATFKDRSYVVDGSSAPVRWDGVAATQLNTTWNDNLETPTPKGGVGAMPIASTVAVHNGMAWVGGTTENTVDYPNRIRFSHPNFAEDWRSEDFIDIDPGVDGDYITALVPYEDRLLVFKQHSVYAVFGYSPESFQVIPVTREVGAISQEAVVGTDLGVYFFSWPEGVFLFDKKGATWQFERVAPALRDGRIPHARQQLIQLGWGNRRLWVAVPWEGSAQRSRCFVLDPALGKSGGWTMYDLPVGPFVEFDPPGDNALFLAVDVRTNRILRLDQEVPYDDFGQGRVPVATRWRTPWVDLGEPAVPKRWKRPEVVLEAGTGAEVTVKAYKDYDPTVVSRSFLLNSAAADTPGDGWGAPWGVMRWSRTMSATSESRRNEMDRGSPLGNARSVALEFSGPSDDYKRWGLNSVTFKFLPRKVRS